MFLTLWFASFGLICGFDSIMLVVFVWTIACGICLWCFVGGCDLVVCSFGYLCLSVVCRFSCFVCFVVVILCLIA